MKRIRGTYGWTVWVLCFLGFGNRGEAHSLEGAEDHAHHETVAWPESLGNLGAWKEFAQLSPSSPKDVRTVGVEQSSGQPVEALPFQVFSKAVSLRWDEEFLFVESNGMPDHSMMVGIRRWIGRFPMPQNYRGSNAWSIPLHPKPAAVPQSARTGFYRGAIAMAANGVPIFNPLTNGGRDTFLSQELDQFGGHAGNGEDYHYHIAPLHLQSQLGPALPIAYALDGYPIYGLKEPNGQATGKLDALNGHIGPKGDYHYHASMSYPYVNGGFYGIVQERGGQVDPQPRSTLSRRQPFRADRNAVITGFRELTPNQHYQLEYTARGRVSSVEYVKEDLGQWRFRFRSANGSTSEETIVERSPGGADSRGRRDGRRGGDRRSPRPRRR